MWFQLISASAFSWIAKNKVFTQLEKVFGLKKLKTKKENTSKKYHYFITVIFYFKDSENVEVWSLSRLCSKLFYTYYIHIFNGANDKNAQNMAKTPKTKFRLKLK